MVWDSRFKAFSAKLMAIILLCFSIVACGKKLVSSTRTGSCTSRISPTYTSVAEAAVCSTSFVPSSSDVMTVNADYQARTMNSNGELTGLTNRPIRFAEIEVTTSTGQIVACSETNLTGDATITVPDNLGVLAVKVKSRSNNVDELRASVLNCPEENQPYTQSAEYDPATPGAVTIYAAATGAVIGGAFNILDQFYDANEFLRNQVGNCGGDSASLCRSVTTSMPKVQAYWAKGFNPNAYFGAPSSGVSYYLPGYSRLFILGGINGDVNTTDTDHFDNSVILHEYGHFLEDIASNTDSPGGPHSGRYTIDPRLAWSEGFGNFIQAAITGIPFYRDSKGNIDGGVGNYSAFFNIDLETPAVTCGLGSAGPSGCDIPIADGEGNFREFSVARMLWDVFDLVDDTGDNVDNSFLNLWRGMTSATGLPRSTELFRTIGSIHEYSVIDAIPDWTTLRTAHKQGKTEDYSRYVTQSMSSCSYNMDPYSDNFETYTGKEEFTNSNLAENNDFYWYYHSGGTFNLTLSSTTTSGAETDLDLYILNVSADLTSLDDVVAKNSTFYDANAMTAQNISVSPNLAAGNYLIRVFAYTGRNQAGTAFSPAGGPLNYTLTLSNGNYLCPSTRP
jgi:hypothetical protein